MKWSDKVKYQGKTVNRGTLGIFTAANKILQGSSRYGKEKEDLTLTQGSYSNAVAASGSTHSGGGSYDITAFNYKNRVKVFRILGTASWYRPTIKGLWNHHIHGIVCGDGTASTAAQGQVNEFYKGGDGLVGSKPDPDWRPKVLPILFVAPWDDRGKPGTHYFATDSTRYDEPNTQGTKRGSSKVGDKFEVVAVVNVKGELWAIDVEGDCVPKKALSLTKPTSGGTTGCTTPEPQPEPKPEPEPKPDPAPGPKPEPTPATSATVRVFGVNAAAYYLRGTYSARVPKLNAMRHQARGSIAIVCESNTYADGAKLNKAFGWGGERGKSFILHGPDVRITTAVHWDPKKYELVAEGQYDTLKGSTHNGATWVILRHLESGLYLMCVGTHLQYLPKGSNKTKTKWDTERQTQLTNCLNTAKKIAADYAKKLGVKHIPIICGEDFNAHRNDAYDGPGAAMKATGFGDAERVKKAGTSIAMYDRFAVRDVEVSDYQPIKSNGGTDHSHGLVIAAKITNA